MNSTLEPFPETGGTRMVGVNSFGLGGANAHIIIEEAPLRPHNGHSETPTERAWPIVLSARSEDALRGSALHLAQWLDERSHANGDSPLLPDLVHSLGARRNHHPYRLTVVTNSMTELVQELDGFGVKQESPKVRIAFTPRREAPPRIAFVMSGQGPQWWGMGRELMRHEPVFRATLERCAAAMKPWGFSLLEELARTEETSQMQRTEIAQPAIFAMQVSLAELWKSWGIQPAAIVGHSVGEIAAACVAGVFSLEEGARIIVQRGRFIDGCARGEGTMLGVGLGERRSACVDRAPTDAPSTIAANHMARVRWTLAGARISLEQCSPSGAARGLRSTPSASISFQSTRSAAASEELEKALADLVPQADTIPFFSTVTGGRCPGETCNAVHWGRGVRQPVQFASAVNALAEFGVDVWLEIGAHPALVHSIQECLAGRSAKVSVLSSMRREREQESLIETAMDLHRAGVSLDFTSLTPSRRLLSMPAYAWDKSRGGMKRATGAKGGLPGGRGSEMSAARDGDGPRAEAPMAFLKRSQGGSTHLPGAGFVDLVMKGCAVV